MPVQNGEFIQYTEDEIYERLESNLEDLLGASAQPGQLVTRQLKAEAETLAENQEAALQRIYQASYLADANGEELDKLVDLIGLNRREPTAASGTVRFGRESPPNQDYVIPRGTTVQTSESPPLEFNTTQKSTLEYIDGFEGTQLEGWDGDTGSVSIVSTNVLSGDQALEMPASSGVGIYTIDSYKVGGVLEVDYYPNGDCVTGIQAGLQDVDNYFEAEVDLANGIFNLREVEAGSEINLAQDSSLSISVSQAYHITFDWALYGDIRATLWETDSKDSKITELFLETSNTWKEGSWGVSSNGGTAKAYLDEVSLSGTTVNIEADRGGIDTNVARNAITIMSDSLAGVESVINEVPTGNPDYLDTNLAQLTIGRDRETDEQLRERALTNTQIGGAATATAVGTSVNELDSVQSVKMFKNKTNSSKDGLPAHSFEVVVHGGDDADIANAIFDSKAIDSTDFGGAHGTEQTYTITDDILANDETIHWSQPTSVSLDITLDLIVDDTFIGEEDTKSLVVNYIGGTDSDGSFVPGVEPGDDIYVAVLKERLVSPSDTGIWEVDSVVLDKDDDGNDDVITNTNGAEVLSVASGEVAEANARDSSITINTVTK